MQKVILLGFILLLSIICCCGTSAINQLYNDDLNYQLSTLSQTTKQTSTENTPINQSFSSTPEIKPTTSSTSTSQPTYTITPKSGITLEGIYLLYLSTTELQFKEYMSYTYGEKITEEVVVGQVMDDGKVVLAGKWSESYYGIYEFCVVVQNVPKDIALSYVKGKKIYLEASIYGLVGNYNYYWDCENTLILSYIDSH